MHAVLSRATWARCLILTVLICTPDGVGAQTRRVGTSLGIAIPTGAAGEERDAGLVISAILDVAPVGSADVRLRGSVAWFPGERASGPPYYGTQGDMRAIGVLAEAVFTMDDPRFPAYWLIGLGPYWLNSELGVENPYGAAWGAGTGLGLVADFGRLELGAEARWDVILSDFGVAEGMPWTVVGLMVGIRWELESRGSRANSHPVGKLPALARWKP